MPGRLTRIVKSMKASIYRRYGPPDVVQLEDVAKPAPKDNEILVRVHATTVCATDSRVRKAEYFIFRLFIGLSKPRKPVIAGVEFSGRVVQVGRDVSRLKVGDLVFGWPGSGKGAHAEYICMPESGAVELKPANMSLVLIAGPFLPNPGRLWAAITGAAKIVSPFAAATVRNLGPHLTFLKELIESGKLRTVIGRRYAFAEIVEAHAYADTGHKVGSAFVLVDDVTDP